MLRSSIYTLYSYQIPRGYSKWQMRCWSQYYPQFDKLLWPFFKWVIWASKNWVHLGLNGMDWTRRSMWSKAQSSEVEKKSGWRVKRRGGKSDTNLFTVSSAKRGRAQNKAEKGGRAVGRSNDKFLGPRVPGVAADNSEVWGGSNDYRFFTRQCSVCARRYCLQISLLSEMRKDLVVERIWKFRALNQTDKIR